MGRQGWSGLLVKRGLAALLVLPLSGCVLFARPLRPPRASDADLARFQFPLDLPAEGRTQTPAAVAVATQLAMDDFRPLDLKPHKNATADELCLYRRDSFDVWTAPGPEGVLFVRFVPRQDACNSEGPVTDASATYAIDTRQWRIIGIQR
ncbi:hypothetical protein D7X96_32520 [Corallococcus interemptor]|uniref:Uncharacterized protein n=1 Tax=Corallococcus interemptor TaxID=2316720 RepID=A0A3A8PXD9_9BACT|nr:hypothetical protein [Corallococcus interemptor]RKH61033.1 hypothetical protein D7X96_32520 [Corallococcus interemptor]